MAVLNLEQIAAKTGDLPTLPQVATTVLQMVREPRTTVKQLEQVISKDQALTARVLRISNSAFYGVRGEVRTLSRAIVILGFNTLRSVVLTASTQILYRAKNSSFKDRILWEHSLATAIAARTLAGEVGFDAAEEAFVGGLLHDIGKVVMDGAAPDQYQKVIELVYNDNRTFLDAEREIFGYDHTEVGALVAKKWTLAPDLQEAVRLHHAPREATVAPQLTALVALGNLVTVRQGIGPEKRPDVDLDETGAASLAGIGPERIEGLTETILSRLEDEKAVFSLS